MNDWINYVGDRSTIPWSWQSGADVLEVRFRNGGTKDGQRDRFVWAWANPEDTLADAAWDIVAYRIVEAGQ